jgi:hypothetical protein
MAVAELIQQVLELPTAERAEVAAEVLFSLHPGDFDDADDQAWMAEIQSRREEVLKGETTMRNWSDVRAEMLHELRSPRPA